MHYISFGRQNGKTTFQLTLVLESIWKENKGIRLKYPEFKDFYDYYMNEYHNLKED